MAALGQAPQHALQTQEESSAQLEFHQAMKDFKVMFPGVDEDVIEAVLRSNQGSVDDTIDQLLTMSVDYENERLRTEIESERPPDYTPTTPPPSYQQAVPDSERMLHKSSKESAKTVGVSDVNVSVSEAMPDLLILNEPNSATPLSVEVDQLIGATAAPVTEPPQRVIVSSQPQQVAVPPRSHRPLQASKSWNPLLLPLPADFLRIKGLTENRKHSNESMMLSSELLQQKLAENARQRLDASADPDVAQLLEDERVALFLQNEEFVQELRTNKDFMTALEIDSDTKKNPVVDEYEPNTLMTFGGLPGDNDDAFRERLRNMGKVSRRKFSQLARLFSGRKKRPTKHTLGQGGSDASRDNLLFEDDDCRTAERGELEALLDDEESKYEETNKSLEKGTLQSRLEFS